MMKTSLSLLARRTAHLASRNVRAPPAALSWNLMRANFSSSSPKDVDDDMPPYDGHLDPEKMNTLSHMFDKIETMESHVQEMKAAHADNMPEYDGHLNPEQKATLDHMYDRIQNLESYVAELKALTKDAQKTYAVDSPDGFSDAFIKEEMQEIEHIIDEAAAHEDKDKIEKEHQLQEDLTKDAQKTYAVDSPDGFSDGFVKEEMQEIEHIIDEAAALEDKDKIEKEHKLQEDVKKFHARDPEHDW